MLYSCLTYRLTSIQECSILHLTLNIHLCLNLSESFLQPKTNLYPILLGNFRVQMSLPNGLSPYVPPNKIISVRSTRQSFYLKPPTPLVFLRTLCAFYFTSSSSDLQMWNFKCRVLGKKSPHENYSALQSSTMCLQFYKRRDNSACYLQTFMW